MSQYLPVQLTDAGAVLTFGWGLYGQVIKVNLERLWSFSPPKFLILFASVNFISVNCK